MALRTAVGSNPLDRKKDKTPGEYEPRKPISKEEREARKELRDTDAKLAMTEHVDAAEAFNKNRERLKRLAREAGAVTPPPKKKKAGLKGKAR